MNAQVNVLGPQILFQATYPLLKASTPAPKFVIITSASGSLTISPPMSVPNGAYGMSKAAVNYLARMLHFENEGLGEWSVPFSSRFRCSHGLLSLFPGASGSSEY